MIENPLIFMLINYKKERIHNNKNDNAEECML